MVRGTRVPLSRAVPLEDSPPRALRARGRKLLQEAGHSPWPLPGPDLRPPHVGVEWHLGWTWRVLPPRGAHPAFEPCDGTPCCQHRHPRLQTRPVTYPASQDGPATDTASAFPVLRGPGRAPWAWLAPPRRHGLALLRAHESVSGQRQYLNILDI